DRRRTLAVSGEDAKRLLRRHALDDAARAEDEDTLPQMIEELLKARARARQPVLAVGDGGCGGVERGGELTDFVVGPYLDAGKRSRLEALGGARQSPERRDDEPARNSDQERADGDREANGQTENARAARFEGRVLRGEGEMDRRRSEDVALRTAHRS